MKAASACALVVLLAMPARVIAQDEAEPLATIPVSEENSDEAQPESNSTRLDDITVTANKRAKSQRDIPASIGAFTGDALEKINAVSIKDYLKTVPGVQMVEKEQDKTIVTIRGISVATTFSQTAGTVGVFLDDLPLNDSFQNLTAPDINPFDLERVEVLKGPQGTLFGAGALSGAIRYITKKPDLAVWNAKLQSTYSSNRHGEPRQFLGGAVNIPVYRDEAALRIAVTYLDRGGMIDAVNSFEAPDAGQPMEDQPFDVQDRGKDIDDLLQKTMRATGQWDFSDRLRINLMGLHQRSNTDDVVSVDNPDGEFKARNHRRAKPQESLVSAYNIVPSYEFDWGTLTSSTGYITKRFQTVTESVPSAGEENFTSPDGEPGDDFGIEDTEFVTSIIPFGTTQRGIVQEFRLASPEGGDSRWEWLGGLSYSNAQQKYSYFSPTSPHLSNARDSVPADQCPAPACPVPTPLGEVNGREYELADTDYDSDVGREMALFGEATYKFFEDRNLELTLGGRLFRNRLGTTINARGVNVLTIPRASVHERRDVEEDGFNPKASLRYIFNPMVQTYLLAAKGFQFGGVQLNPPLAVDQIGSPEAFQPYKSSKLWLYEWGWRTDFFDRRLRLDWTAYYYDWTDLQLQRASVIPQFIPQEPALPDDMPIIGPELRFQQTRRVGLGSYITNVGRAKSTGLEAALSVTPLRGLTFSSSANWLKARLTEDYSSPTLEVPAGTPLAGAPRFQISNSLSYETPIQFLGAWEAAASLSHLHVSDTAPDLFQSDLVFETIGTEKYDTLSCSMRLTKPDWAFSPNLSLTINNLTDVRAINQINGCERCRNLAIYYNQPRTAILGLDLKW